LELWLLPKGELYPPDVEGELFLAPGIDPEELLPKGLLPD
jgi:hypothetical protein